MARTYYQASDTGQSTTTSSTYGDKVALTLTAAQQAASTDYYILWSALVQANSTSQDVKVRLYNDTGAAALQEFNIEAKDTTDYVSAFGVARFTSAGTPADNTFSIEFANEDNATTVRIKEARIVILKKETGDEYAESTGSSSNATGTWTDKTTLSFTPGSAGDYLFVASAGLDQNTTTQPGYFRLHDGSAALREINLLYKDASNWMPAFTIAKGTGLSGSQTWKIQFKSSSTDTCTIRQAMFLALRLDTFDVAQYATSDGASTSTSASYQDKTTLTFTPEALDHLLLSTSYTGNGSTTQSIFAKVDKGGATLQAEMLAEPAFTTTASPLSYPHGIADFSTLAASSTTWKTQYHTETGGTTGAMAESAIAVLQLEASASGLSLALDSVAWSRSVTAVALEHGREIVPASVSWARSVTNVTFTAGQIVTPETVAWARSVQAVSYEHGWEIVPASVSWARSVSAVALEKGHEIVPATVAWSRSLDAVAFEQGREIVPETVAWARSVTDVTFTLLADKVIVPDTVAWARSVTDVALEAGHEIVPETVAWARSIADITFTYAPGGAAPRRRNRRFIANVGSFMNP